MISEKRQRTLFLLILFAFTKILLHTLTNGQYGFHRDELQTLDDARTPFIGRIALELFGTSLAGFRFFAAAAQAAVLILSGFIARELGGRGFAQIAAALAVAIAPVSLSAGSLFQDQFILAARLQRSAAADADRPGNIEPPKQFLGPQFRIL